MEIKKKNEMIYESEKDKKGSRKVEPQEKMCRDVRRIGNTCPEWMKTSCSEWGVDGVVCNASPTA